MLTRTHLKRAMGARAVVVHVVFLLLALARGAEGQADLSDFNAPTLGRRVAGLGTMVCQHMHVRPIPLLRVRISEGLTQANS